MTVSNAVVDAVKRARFQESAQGVGIEGDICWDAGWQKWVVTIVETRSGFGPVHFFSKRLDDGESVEDVLTAAKRNDWMTERHLHSLKILAETAFARQGQSGNRGFLAQK